MWYYLRLIGSFLRASIQEETASREPDAPQPDTAFLLQIGGVPPAASHGSRRGTGG